MLKTHPISKVLESAPKDMDKESLLQLAEDAVAYYPERLLNVSYEDFWDDEYDDIKIFKQISDFASEEIRSNVDFLYKLFSFKSNIWIQLDLTGSEVILV